MTARKVHVTPGGLTALQAKIGIVIASFFLLLGLVFGVVVGLENTSSSEGGLMILQGVFLLIWVVACLSIIVFYARLLSKRTPEQNSLLDVHLENTVDAAPNTGDFESRLRKLERLKQDGLITEPEYVAKREKILQEKW
ncbi:MAG: SHOCT domain-containing protein [Desulfobacterales bacterium]|nr:SHOCT domain-containing protein [Desulfobacterales bacterium]